MIQERNAILDELRENLHKAQDKMKILQIEKTEKYNLSYRIMSSLRWNHIIFACLWLNPIKSLAHVFMDRIRC